MIYFPMYYYYYFPMKYDDSKFHENRSRREAVNVSDIQTESQTTSEEMQNACQYHKTPRSVKVD